MHAPKFSLRPLIQNWIFIALALLFTACGGGGGEGNPVNTPPPLNTPPPTADAGGAITASPSGIVTLDATGSSPGNSGTLTYAWRQLNGPNVTLSANDTPTVTFTAPPSIPGSAQTLIFEIVVTEGSESAMDQVTVTIAAGAVNNAPVADAGPDQNPSSGTQVTLNGSGSNDPDGDAITYSWTQTGGYAVGLQPGNNVPSPQFIPPVLAIDEILTFELRVSDGSLNSLDTVMINLTAATTGPYDVMASAGSDQTVTEGDSATLSAAASTNPYSSPLTYQWRYTGDNDNGNRYGPDPVIADDTAETISFTAPGVSTQDFDREMRFQLTVSNGVQNHTDEVRVTVWPVDTTPPTANPVVPSQTLGGYRDSVTGEWIVRVSFDATLSVQFSDIMDPASFTSTSFYLVEESNGNIIPSTISTPDNNRSFVLTPNDLLSAETLYRIHYSSDITDRSGNRFAGDSWLFSSTFDGNPTADVGARRQFVNYGDTITLDGSASMDSEQSADTLTYAWSGPADITINNADQPIASFTAPDYVTGGEFVLTVTDRSDNTSTDSTYILAMEDVDNAVFVHTFSGDDANLGAWNTPVQTLTRALTLAGQGASARDIYLSGNFTNIPATISLPDGVSIHGGLLAQTVWNNPNQIDGWIDSGARTRIRVNTTTGIIAQDITMSTTLSRIDLDVQSGAAGINAAGGASIGLLVRNGTPSAFIIRNNDIAAGRGGDGANGVQPAQTASGSPGTDGDDGGNGNSTPNGGTRGAAGCGSGRGGNGGSGGYGNNSGDSGSDGRRADGSSSTNGGQRGLILNGVASNGGPGLTDFVQGGAGGNRGFGGTLDGNGFYIAGRGFTGETGEHGTGGGGGGGGAGGPLAWNNIADTGGGGGGGGGGGCAGRGGTGGYGGGGSYAIYLIDASPIIEGNQLTTVGGGTGGNGGGGGMSGSGGLRGSGGSDGGEPGGDGGNGGHGSAGGAGGGGGGGSGGHSYSIFQATVSTSANPDIRGDNNYTVGSGGIAGSGGSGGEPGPRGNVWPEVQSGQPGDDGDDGLSRSIGSAS